MRYITHEERDLICAALDAYARTTLGRERSLAESLAVEFSLPDSDPGQGDDYTPGAPTCNEHLVRDLMNYSPTGALAQVFIVDAIQQRAQRVAQCDPKTFDSPMVSGAAWVRCAKHIADTMRAFYSRHDAVKV